MNTAAFENIRYELAAHPRERKGFYKADFDLLTADERPVLIEQMMREAECRWGIAEQLRWLLGDQYIPALEGRLQALPKGAHGRVYLPYYLYMGTKDNSFLIQMMREVAEGDPRWEGRARAVGDYLRRIIGQEELYWDFCRYLVMYDPDAAMKEEALRWLCHEKGFRLDGFSLTEELRQCIAGLMAGGAGADASVAILDKIHKSTGRFSMT